MDLINIYSLMDIEGIDLSWFFDEESLEETSTSI